MRRRDFIALIGGAAAAWPFAWRAQQAAMPVIGFLNGASPRAWKSYVEAFRQGLSEAGYVEGRTVTIEYRWAEGQYERLPVLAEDLVRRNVALIVATGGSATALAAKAATNAIPILFTIGADPVKLGLVASLNRPGGNLTGVSLFVTQMEGKRLGLLRELVPAAALIAVLLNPNSPIAATQLKDVQEAARPLNQHIHILNAGSEAELEAAFETLRPGWRRRLIGRSGSVFQQPARLYHRISGAARDSDNLRAARTRPGRRPDELRHQSVRRLSPGRHVRRSYPQG
jgi:putative tryptophan/tyrosine transport system substrate-binding protein